MRILAFDTSSSWCSIAVGEAGHWLEADEALGQTHSERLLPIAQGLLAAAGWTLKELDAIAFGAGPGSFTGVRIACGVAQGLAFGLERPAVPVSTLQAIAQEAGVRHDAPRVLACTDARMGEAYAAAYIHTRQGCEEVLAPAVLAPAAVALPAQPGPWVGAGNAYAAYPDLAARLGLARVLSEVRPTGRAVGELALQRLKGGESFAPEDALPLYVRHRVALTTAERAAGVRL